MIVKLSNGSYLEDIIMLSLTEYEIKTTSDKKKAMEIKPANEKLVMAVLKMEGYQGEKIT